MSKIIAVSVLIFLSGCVTLPSRESRKPLHWRGITNDAVVFRDLQQVDLDKDGEKEMIAVYATAANNSGVKVIKFYNGKGEVIFGRHFESPYIKLMMEKNTPVLITEEITQVAAGCSGVRTRNVYRWNGKAFIQEKSGGL